MATEILTCPFCGGTAELIDIPSVDEAENAGGSYVGCSSCGASSAVVFGEKQGLKERWNRRAVRALEQGGEIREALKAVAGIRRMVESIERCESWEGGFPEMGTCRILGDIKRISDQASALLDRERAEPVLEEHDLWIDTDALPPKPAEELGPEVDALLWMTERLMGSSAASIMRGWLAEYRATGKLVVRDADGTVKEYLTVAEPAEVETRIKEGK